MYACKLKKKKKDFPVVLMLLSSIDFGICDKTDSAYGIKVCISSYSGLNKLCDLGYALVNPTAPKSAIPWKL